MFHAWILERFRGPVCRDCCHQAEAFRVEWPPGGRIGAMEGNEDLEIDHTVRSVESEDPTDVCSSTLGTNHRDVCQCCSCVFPFSSQHVESLSMLE